MSRWEQEPVYGGLTPGNTPKFNKPTPRAKRLTKGTPSGSAKNRYALNSQARRAGYEANKDDSAPYTREQWKRQGEMNNRFLDDMLTRQTNANAREGRSAAPGARSSGYGDRKNYLTKAEATVTKNDAYARSRAREAAGVKKAAKLTAEVAKRAAQRHLKSKST